VDQVRLAIANCCHLHGTMQIKHYAITGQCGGDFVVQLHLQLLIRLLLDGTTRLRIGDKGWDEIDLIEWCQPTMLVLVALGAAIQ
jgi:hypothetical protein